MRRKLMISAVTLLGAVGLTVSGAAPASADTYRECHFFLKSGSDSSAGEVSVYAIFSFINGRARAHDIRIYNGTGRDVTLVTNKWEQVGVAADRGPGGILYFQEWLHWEAPTAYYPSRRVAVSAAATTRPGLGGSCSIYV